MKKILFVIFFFLVVNVVCSMPMQYILDPEIASPPGQYIRNLFGNASGAIYVHLVGNSALDASSSYYITVNATYTPQYRSYQPLYYPVSLATNTGTLVSSFVTLSFPCIIEIGSNEGTIYCGPATTNAATLKLQGKKLSPGNFWSIVATGPIDFGLVAAPTETANASGLVIILPQK